MIRNPVGQQSHDVTAVAQVPGRKVRFGFQYPLGDQVVFAGALRELHRCHPGGFEIEIESPIPDFWLHCPYARVIPPPAPDRPSWQAAVSTTEEVPSLPPGMERVVVDGEFFKHPNHRPRHMLQSLVDTLNSRLGTRIEVGQFRGEATLSEEEMRMPGPVEALIGERLPYWIVCNGGKFDRTVKWWPTENYQKVVSALNGRLLFVQVGRTFDYHPKLKGALDFRGWSDIRTLLRLVHWADGVICPITSLMHLAASVRRPAGFTGPRPCVIVGGGIEPPHWTVYPGQRFLSTVGAIPCAAEGCWKSRTVSLGDGTSRDNTDARCVNVAGLYPACMQMIRSGDVVRAVEGYLEGGASRVLTARQAEVGRASLGLLGGSALDDRSVNRFTARLAIERQVRLTRRRRLPGAGRGIVTLAHGRDYAASAWVMLRLQRHLGCSLPAQVWLMDDRHWLAPLRGAFARLDAEVRFHSPRVDPVARRSSIFAAKPEVIAASRFQEVLWIDADSFPARDPSYLFELPEYREHGAILWPEPAGYLSTKPEAWPMFGLPEDNATSECQGGEMLFDKARVSPGLLLARWCNRHFRHFYSVLAGDKDIFRLALRKAGQTYAMPAARAILRDGCLFQEDFQGRPLFQHRVAAKFKVGTPLTPVSGFEHHDLCQRFLDEFSASVAPALLPARVQAKNAGSVTRVAVQIR